MAQKTGTYSIADLQAANNASAVAIGEDNIAAVLAEDNANFSAAVNEQLADVSATTDDRQRAVGSSIGGIAMEVDEFGQAPTQRDRPGYLVGFPLKRITFPIGFTKQWLKNASGADVAVRNAAAQGAHLRRMRYELQTAIFGPTNTTFNDHLVDNAALAVKALINADSSSMSNGPNGETFDGTTHSHYNANATLTNAVALALVTDVVEHRNGARVRIDINLADAASWLALADSIPLQTPVITLDANQANTRLDLRKTDNRQIGYFGAAELWTKPYVPANYAVATDLDAPQKPLVRRTEKNDLGMHLAGEIESHPLQADFTEWFYGFGVWNRTAMAVLRFNNGSYAAPTFSY